MEYLAAIFPYFVHGQTTRFSLDTNCVDNYILFESIMVFVPPRKPRALMRERVQQPNGVIQCQKCLEKGHWTYQCTKKRKYTERPSRTQILEKRIKQLKQAQEDTKEKESKEKADELKQKERMAKIMSSAGMENIRFEKKKSSNKNKDDDVSDAESTSSSSSDSSTSSSDSSSSSSSTTSSSSASENERQNVKKRAKLE
ncbi:unnamed protein product [Didymodactylos carnosus]|uniref:Zinc finger CCHC domain-containing protein 10 n=1 Tax=Didymodactylos carnosus TaxID=1234261 RepID=A0A814GIQ1_9BILA|nr:unnamed protein product [Didymodactylos carnosus]CAF1063123.1 unnamed protein product [Didymodactylos carnosus]CAF3768503.1 unnamed protein product [Didymodactylos carnosus]CAF3828448.1 unnamed protein product [Didymodactylos carnosus]